MIDRRTLFTVALAAVATPVSTRAVLAQAGMSRVTAYAFSFPALVGNDIRLADYASHPLRAAPIWSYLSDRGKSRREGPESASVL